MSTDDEGAAVDAALTAALERGVSALASSPDDEAETEDEIAYSLPVLVLAAALQVDERRIARRVLEIREEHGE